MLRESVQDCLVVGYKSNGNVLLNKLNYFNESIIVDDLVELEYKRSLKVEHSFSGGLYKLLTHFTKCKTYN